jgi:hypothetical protein
MQLSHQNDSLKARDSTARRRVRDLLLLAPSIAWALIMVWFWSNGFNYPQMGVSPWFSWLVFFLGPVVTIYTVVIGILFIRRRNMIGLAIVLCSLPPLVFACIGGLGLYLHGIRIQP